MVLLDNRILWRYNKMKKNVADIEKKPCNILKLKLQNNVKMWKIRIYFSLLVYS